MCIQQFYQHPSIIFHNLTIEKIIKLAHILKLKANNIYYKNTNLHIKIRETLRLVISETIYKKQTTLGQNQSTGNICMFEQPFA